MTSSITSATSETADQLSNSLSVLSHNYAQTTPPRVKLIDTFLLFCLMSGVLQFAYRVLVSSYPYNAFVGGYVFVSITSSYPVAIFRGGSSWRCRRCPHRNQHRYGQALLT
jgi:oligosaccharyltransferase complex subunit epsilon